MENAWICLHVDANFELSSVKEFYDLSAFWFQIQFDLNPNSRLKMLRNLVRSNQRLLTRHCSSVNFADTMPSYFRQREGLLIELLKSHDFNDKQQISICEFVKTNQIQLTDQDLFKIDNSVKFWKKFVLEKPRLSKNNEDLIDHLHVLAITEPSLLFIDSAEMKKRVNLVQLSGFCDSKSDVANLFIKAPKGRHSNLRPEENLII